MAKINQRSGSERFQANHMHTKGDGKVKGRDKERKHKPAVIQ